MRAMILAAGLGTRLLPLTEKKPKALVKVAEVPMLEIILRRLINFGIHDVIINVHHFAEMIIDFLRRKNNFGIHIEISFEKEILGTGGGLKKVTEFFHDDEHFLLHNVDVLTNLDFQQVLNSHLASTALATIVVQDRPTQRYLVFDSKNRLCGRSGSGGQNMNLVREPVKGTNLLAFNGIHVISPKLLPLLEEEGRFSIIDAYLRLASQGEQICCYKMRENFWLDLGRPHSLQAAKKAIRDRVIFI